MFFFHMTGLTQPYEITQFVSFHRGIKFSKGDNVMYWQAVTDVFSAMGAITFLFHNDNQSDFSPTTPSISFNPASIEGRIFSRLILFTIGNNAFLTTTQTFVSAVIQSPLRTLKSFSTDDTSQNNTGFPFGVITTANIFGFKSIGWLKTLTDLIAFFKGIAHAAKVSLISMVSSLTSITTKFSYIFSIRPDFKNRTALFASFLNTISLRELIAFRGTILGFFVVICLEFFFAIQAMLNRLWHGVCPLLALLLWCGQAAKLAIHTGNYSVLAHRFIIAQVCKNLNGIRVQFQQLESA